MNQAQSAQAGNPRFAPLTLQLSRVAFAAYFITLFVILQRAGFVHSPGFSIHWLVYLVAMYGLAEYIYRVFQKQDVDLTFAFPLLLAVYILHSVSLFLQGQERFPDINRAEHFVSFVLLAHIVWVFFLQYLPQRVWKHHPYYTAIIVLAITSFAGVLNEIVELFLDTSFGVGAIGDQFDTAVDLVMNTLGAGLLVSIHLIFGEAKGKFTKESRP